jgi:hypothetical protein
MKKKDIIFIVVGLSIGVGGGLYANSIMNTDILQTNVVVDYILAGLMLLVMVGIVIVSFMLAKTLNKNIEL